MKLQELQQNAKYKIYIDLDGVLANFEAGVQQALKTVYGNDMEYSEERYEKDSKYRSMMWNATKKYQDQYGHQLWYELPLMDDARQLWQYVDQYEPQILTATGKPEYNSGEQKKRWVAKHFGSHIPVNLVRKAAEKKQYADDSHILIDDKEKAIQPWREAGGIGILHTSAVNTIQQLNKFGL